MNNIPRRRHTLSSRLEISTCVRILGIEFVWAVNPLFVTLSSSSSPHQPGFTVPEAKHCCQFRHRGWAQLTMADDDSKESKVGNATPSFTVASSGEDLRYAARIGDMDDVTEILSRYKGDSNELSKFLPAVIGAADSLSGNKALHLCAANGHLDVVRVLIEHGADVDVSNLAESTPLHYASLTGHLDIVKELIKHDAKPVIENKYEKTALDEARSAKKDAVAEFLMNHVEETNEGPDLDKTSGDQLSKQMQQASLKDESK